MGKRLYLFTLSHTTPRRTEFLGTRVGKAHKKRERKGVLPVLPSPFPVQTVQQRGKKRQSKQSCRQNQMTMKSKTGYQQGG